MKGALGFKQLKRVIKNRFQICLSNAKNNSRRYETARDFYVGNSLTINSHCFTLLTTDPSTERTIAELGM